MTSTKQIFESPQMFKSAILAFTTLALSASSMASSDSEDWELLAKGTDRTYTVLTESIQIDITNQSAQFAMKVEYTPPVKLSKKPGDVLVTSVETTLVLCDADKVISMARLGTNQKGEYVVDDNYAMVYSNPKSSNKVITHIYNFACEKVSKHVKKKTI